MLRISILLFTSTFYSTHLSRLCLITQNRVVYRYKMLSDCSNQRQHQVQNSLKMFLNLPKPLLTTDRCRILEIVLCCSRYSFFFAESHTFRQLIRAFALQPGSREFDPSSCRGRVKYKTLKEVIPLPNAWSFGYDFAIGGPVSRQELSP